MSKQAITALENLGFSTYEARAYLGLLQENPINGYRLSKLTGIPRSRVYETLERLTNKGYAVSYQADPVEYAPLGVDELQTQLKEQLSDNLSTLEAEIERMATMDRSESLWNLRGHDAILNRARGMIAKAEKSIYLVAWADTLQALKGELETAVNHNIRTVIISCGDTETMSGIHYCHAFEEDIVQPDSGSINLVVDCKEALAGETTPSESCQAVWSRNSGLVFITEEYIRHEVYLHKIIAQFEETDSGALQQALAAGLQEVPYE
ncbi:MAG: TrmB family transcriptional regulator [Chloroflexi bacterium]|nr:TrmB family transcriptional regulator [Chloroflexota bacterium]